MPRTEIERIIQPSLLDRLTDLEPGSAADPPITRDESVRRFRQSVQRDVEVLLNTRRVLLRAPESCPELHASAYEYGLPDTTGIPIATNEGRERLMKSLQETLERFEPRLANPRVQLVESDQVRAPQVRFVVQATLRLDPHPELVVFDTTLELASGEYAVREGTMSDDDTQ